MNYSKSIQHLLLNQGMKNILWYVKLIRIDHWVKNLFLFLPMFFAKRFLEHSLLTETFYGFISFCFMSSAVYILNDIYDKEEDANHPQKKYRPISAAAITVTQAKSISLICFIVSVSISFFLPSQFLIFLLCYAIINGIYNGLGFKQIPYLEVSLIASGFVIRVQSGGAIGNIPVSWWLNVLTFLLALFLILAKRRGDVLLFTERKISVRKVAQIYNLKLLNFIIVFFAFMLVGCYVVYSVSDEVTTRFKTDKLFLSSVFVLAGMLRFLYLICIQKKSGEPIEILWKDFFIQAILVLWIAFLFLLIYL